MFSIEVFLNGKSVCRNSDENKANVTLENGQWDKIVFTNDSDNFMSISMEPLAMPCTIFAKDGVFEFTYPDDKRMQGFDKKVFDDEISVSLTKADLEYRDLALNPYDIFDSREVVPWDAPEWSNPVHSPIKDELKTFPHAFASRVTRDEGCFYARNAIDGKSGVGGHGAYPYHSWGGGVHEDLSIAVYFGRKVKVDKLLLNLRSDYSIDSNGFEHDTYWKSATLEFSDGSTVSVAPEKTEKDQVFEFDARVTEWVVLKELVPFVNPKGLNFAALNRIGVFGKE